MDGEEKRMKNPAIANSGSPARYVRCMPVHRAGMCAGHFGISEATLRSVEEEMRYFSSKLVVSKVRKLKRLEADNMRLKRLRINLRLDCSRRTRFSR